MPIPTEIVELASPWKPEKEWFEFKFHFRNKRKVGSKSWRSYLSLVVSVKVGRVGFRVNVKKTLQNFGNFCPVSI